MQQGSQGPSGCWRQCGKPMADHFHIFWDCSFIQPFWDEISKEISSIFGTKVANSFVILYLGKLPDNLMTHDEYLYKILLVACKKAINRKWLREEPPSKDEWVAIVNEINCMERLTFSLRLQFDRYIKAWKKWSDHCEECNPL